MRTRKALGSLLSRTSGTARPMLAKANQVAGGVVKLPQKSAEAVETRKEIAKIAGVSPPPVRRVNLDSVIRGEHDENEMREDFRPSERVAIGLALEAEVGERRGRPGENTDNRPELSGETRDLAAKRAGFTSGKQYERAKSVVQAGAPELIFVRPNYFRSQSAADHYLSTCGTRVLLTTAAMRHRRPGRYLHPGVNMTDNDRTPAEHRAIVAEQRQHQSDREESHRGGAWPQGRRLQKVGNTVRLTGLVGWQILNAIPRLAAANDNHDVDLEHTETTERDVVSADDIMAAIEMEKKEPGQHYRAGAQEVFVRGEWRPIDGESSFDRKHSGAAPGWMGDREDEETKRARWIDCQRKREKLGRAVCTLLDLAAGDATTAEIAAAIGCSRARAERYIDMAIDKYLQVAA